LYCAISAASRLGSSWREFQHRGALLADGAPAERVEVAGGAVDDHEFGVRIGRTAVFVGPAIVGGPSGQSLEMAFHEHVSVRGLDVAHPGEGAAVVVELAVQGEQGAASEDGVAVADERGLVLYDDDKLSA